MVTGFAATVGSISGRSSRFTSESFLRGSLGTERHYGAPSALHGGFADGCRWTYLRPAPSSVPWGSCVAEGLHGAISLAAAFAAAWRYGPVQAVAWPCGGGF